jgi:hypothetical protein
LFAENAEKVAVDPVVGEYAAAVNIQPVWALLIIEASRLNRLLNADAGNQELIAKS